MNDSGDAKMFWDVDTLWEIPDDGRRCEIIDGLLFVGDEQFLETPEDVQRVISATSVQLHRDTRPLGLDTFAGPVLVRSDRGTEFGADLIVLPHVDRGGIYLTAQPTTSLLLAAIVSASDDSTHDAEARCDELRRSVSTEVWQIRMKSRSVDVWPPGASDARTVSDELRWLAPGASAACTIDLASMFRYAQQ